MLCCVVSYLASMPQCEGLPSGPCPDGINDRSVTYGQGDLFLCPACFGARTTSRQGITGRSEREGDKPVVIQPLLSYILFSLQSGHFSVDRIR